MKLELNKSYLVRFNERNYKSGIEEFKLIKESLTSYQFEMVDYGKLITKWIIKEDFDEDYKIIELL